jgi:hypothetical protein
MCRFAGRIYSSYLTKALVRVFFTITLTIVVGSIAHSGAYVHLNGKLAHIAKSFHRSDDKRARTLPKQQAPAQRLYLLLNHLPEAQVVGAEND